MRELDKKVFSRVAFQEKLYILVRDTNVDSLDYIGKSGYIPKRIDCKAKTADFNVGNLELKGLVVDPTIHPKAFHSKKFSETIAVWDNRIPKLTGQQLGFSYCVDANLKSKHYGCLMFNGKYIHGDYDLYDIVDPKYPSNNLALVEKLHGEPHMIGMHFNKVKNLVNAQIGVEMIQHSGAAQYALHSQQVIHVFCPDGEYKLIDNLSQLHFWYNDTFNRRITLKDDSRIIKNNRANPAGKNVIRIDSHPDFFRNRKR
jgi:hypothetical protein